MDRYCELFGEEPDYVISGFHMMKKHSYSDEDINMIIDTALALRQYKTVFYTGHCTGVEPYNAMKKLMGNQLHYVHSGDEIRIRTGIERIVWNPRDKAGVLNGDRRAAVAAGAGPARNIGAAGAGPAGNTEAIKANPAQNAAPAINAGPVKTEPIKKTETAKAAQKKRSEYMKWHKFFAWGTVACFVMTMVTGYKRK